MTSIANSSVAKFAAVLAGVALAFSLFAAPAHAALSESQIQSILSLLQSFGADSATVANVNSSLRGTAPTTPTTPSTPSSACTFTRDLTLGATGADVTCLQQALIAGGYSIPAGATGYFGAQTQAAVTAWQKAMGITPSAGYFGPKSRAAFNLGGSSSGPSTTPAPGSGLSVMAGSQPANSLAPQGASRVPFTVIKVTAGNDGDVVVNSLTVRRVGLGSNAAFSGVILVDEMGNQLGTAKTFNSNDEATIGEKVTIPRGTTKTFTVAGNMNSDLSSYTGEAPGVSVVAVNTSAAVSGALPITGAYHTMNSTLTVGSISLDVSNANATNAVATKEIGTTAFKATGFRLTAGSAEDLRLKSVKFNQTGSVSTVNDLANVMVFVGTNSYPVTVSADGKYVTANFGAGILIPKGNNVEVYVTYDIIGSNSANRTVIFDVDKTTDIFAMGETYGYGVSPAVGATAVSSLTRASSNTTETSGTPYIYGAQITITGASVTTIQKDTAVAAQNIAINVPNQPLGGFVIDIKGEPITVQSLVFTVASSSGSGTGQLTNVTIVDENGAVVAGPVDTSGAGTSLTFPDSITFSTGKHAYRILGKVASTIGGGTVYTLSTTPSSSTSWVSPKGDITGNTVTLSQGSFSMNAMTVKAGTLAVGRATSPASQNVVAGGTSVLMANFQFDATQSGEDVRFSSVPVLLDVDNGTNNLEGDPDYLTNCQLFDGSTALNTGSNVLNPSNAATTSDDTDTVTLDNPVTVTKGTVKTLGMRCNISSSVPSSSEYLWDTQAVANFTLTGAVSGTSITTGTDASDSAIVVTVTTGSTTVTTDASSPGYKLASAGSTDVIVGAMKFRATNEALNLTKLGLTLSNSASSSAGDLVKVSIYDGSTKVGEAFFTGSNTTATSTLTQVVVLPKDQDKTLTLKAEFANIGIGQAVTFSGHLVAVNYLNGEGTGAESGTTQQLSSSAGSTAVAGVRVFKSFPVVAPDSLPSTGIADGRLMRFKVTADSKGPIGLTELNFLFSTTTATLSNVNVFVYEDSNYSTAVSGLQASGQFSTTNGLGTNWASGTTNIEFTAYNGSASTTLQIPAGATRYFEVRGTVSGAISGASITTTLRGASAFVTDVTPSAATSNPLATSTSDKFGNDFIWSPNSTTTVTRAGQDWTGGYGVNGLPSNGLINTRGN